MTNKTQTPSRALQQIDKPPLLKLTPEPANTYQHASIDCLGAMREAAKFFIQQALEAPDEKTARRAAREAKRVLKALARYRLLGTPTAAFEGALGTTTANELRRMGHSLRWEIVSDTMPEPDDIRSW
jgi:hypothetical protein